MTNLKKWINETQMIGANVKQEVASPCQSFDKVA